MKTRLHIDRLVVRTRGLTPAAAKGIAGAIGPALAEGLQTRVEPGRIPELKVTLPAAAAGSPAHIAEQLAAQLASAPRL
jgi:hypothetical protein